MKAVEVRGLSFSYGSNRILEDINFSIDQGDFVALIGSNGSGKSTLMKLILGELSPSAGEIYIMGKKVKRDMALPEIRYVAQAGLGINSSFPCSCEELVSTGIYKGLGKKLNKADKEKVLKALKLVNMEGYEKRNIGKLSGGQRQRVLLARSLVSSPQILMLDEPTAGIDRDAALNFYKLIEKLNKEEGLSIINITHDLDRIHSFADRVFCLGDSSFHELSDEQIRLEVKSKHKHPRKSQEV